MAGVPCKLSVASEKAPPIDFKLPAGTVTIGRAAINDIVLDDQRVSRQHARIDYDGTRHSLVDLGSANGTRVNGAPAGRVVLAPGDAIEIGDATLRFEWDETTTAGRDTVLASVADLEAALRQEALPVMVADTREPCLVVISEGASRAVPFPGDVVTIGRDAASDIVVDTPLASRAHARIERRRNDVMIKDLGSRNGTWVNGRKVGQQILGDGDTIRIGDVRVVFKKGFQPDELTSIELTSPARRVRHRPVVFVPGIMGSELWLGSERLWPNLKYLFASEIGHLPGDSRIEARALTREVVIVPNLIKLDQYGRLSNYLEQELGYERGRNLLEFPYDWRQDNRLSARRLADAIDAWQATSPEATGPVTIIAHSLGCLVTRYYLERLGGNEKVERAILLGGPHHGVPRAISVLLFGPGLLPFGLLDERMRRALMTFPSIYQLLPTYACATDQDGQPINVLQDEDWLAETQRPQLRDARQFWRELGTRCSVPAVSIFGYGIDTVSALTVRRDDQRRWQRAEHTSQSVGDSVVPETSTLLEGADIHPVRQYHGALYTDSDVKMRLKIELTRGLFTHR
jgi:pSer/pThr/pTyr-binding forkhead associated (FHA) protein